MYKSQFRPKMQEEIQSRKNSIDWSSSIAEDVKTKRNNIIKRNSAIGSSLIAVIIITFFLGSDFIFNKNISPELYSKFISEQIEGTYNLSEGKKINDIEKVQLIAQQDIVFSNSIDETISSAMARR